MKKAFLETEVYNSKPSTQNNLRSELANHDQQPINKDYWEIDIIVEKFSYCGKSSKNISQNVNKLCIGNALIGGFGSFVARLLIPMDQRTPVDIIVCPF